MTTALRQRADAEASEDFATPPGRRCSYAACGKPGEYADLAEPEWAFCAGHFREHQRGQGPVLAATRPATAQRSAQGAAAAFRRPYACRPEHEASDRGDNWRGTYGPDLDDVRIRTELLNLLEGIPSSEGRARYLLTSTWLRERGAAAASRSAEQLAETPHQPQGESMRSVRVTDPHAVRVRPGGHVASTRGAPEVLAELAMAGVALQDPRVLLGDSDGRGEIKSVTIYNSRAARACAGGQR